MFRPGHNVTGLAGLLIAVATMTIVVLGGQGVAEAAGSKCGTAGNYFAGTASTTQAFIRGARATIEPDNPDLCAGGTGSPSDSSAWVLVAALKVGTTNTVMYAQSGYAKIGSQSPDGNQVPGGGLRRFTQHAKTCYPNCSYPQSQWVTWYSGGVEVSHTGYNALDYWQPGWNSQWAGETLHNASDVPGTPSDKVSMWNLQYYKYGGDYSFVTSVTDSSDSRYYVEHYSPGPGGIGINIWTYPIS